MQHHFVVYFDDVTKTWNVDAETTDARFDSNVWNPATDEWEDWNDATSEALNSLIDLIEIDSESDEPIQTEAYQDIDPNSTYGSMLSPLDDLEEWGADLSLQNDWSDNALIEETDYLEEDDE